METIWQDVRYGMRTLAARPGFTAVALLTLALGIGANTAIFSVVNAVLLAPLPYQDGGQLVIAVRRAPTLLRTLASYPDLTDFQQSGAFEDVAAIRGMGFFLEGEGGPELVSAAGVSPGFFKMLGVRPAAGRAFLPDEERARARVAVIGDELWARHFVRDPKVIGKPIKLSGTAYTVVGVLPADYRDPLRPVSGRDIYVPMQVQDSDVNARNSQWLHILARIPLDRTLAQVRSIIEPYSEQAYREFKSVDVRSLPSFSVIPLRENQLGSTQTALWLILGAVTFVLLIGCANVANLLLARLTSRSNELAIRAAVGASRMRLATQLMTESLLLSLLGGIGALVFVLWGLDLVKAISPVEVPWMDRARLGLPVFTFALLASLVCGLLFGALPALRGARLNLLTALQSGKTGNPRQRRSLNLLLAGEVALTVVLLAGAMLSLTSFVRLTNVDPGFETGDVLTVGMTYAGEWRSPQQAAFADELLARLRALPGVKAAGAVDNLPLTGSWSQVTTTADTFLEDVRPELRGQKITYEQGVISGDYFQAMRISVLAGRTFTSTSADAGGPPVVMVSADLARNLWGDADAVGKRVSLWDRRTQKSAWATVIGVTGGIHHRGLSLQTNPTLYRFLPHTSGMGQFTVILHGENPAQFAPTVRQLARQLDRAVIVTGTRTFDQIFREHVAEPRFLALLLTSFATVAVLLAAVGIYGVLSYAVGQRRQEIGIRMALGARPAEVLRMTVAAGMKWTLAGLAVGLVAALWLSRFIKTQLFEVSVTDPMVYTGIALFLGAIALLACWIPARRAARVDPMVALRHE